MAPRPLRAALRALLAACLASTAGAADVTGPAADAGGAPASNSGGAAASVNSLPPGVSLVPSAPGGLSPLSAPAASLSAPVPTAGAVAAPSAAPSATPVPLAAPAKAGAVALPAAAAAQAGPAKLAPIEAAPPDLHAKIMAKIAAQSASGAAASAPGDAKALASGTFLDLDVAHLPAASINKLLNKIFDRSRDHDLAGEEETGVLSKPPVPALKPLAAAASGPEARPAPAVPVAAGPIAAPVVAAPAPPKASTAEATKQKAQAVVSKLWRQVKQGLGMQMKAGAAKPAPAPLPEPATQAEDRAPAVGPMGPLLRPSRADPLETSDGLLVHAPRALRFDALGYRVHFAPPTGFESQGALDDAVRVRVERGQGDAGTEVLRARFAVFNQLIETNFSALELIAQSSSNMNVKTARIVLDKAASMAADYAKLAGPRAAVDAHAGLAGLGIRFDQAVKGLGDSDPLPPEAVQLMMPLDQESVHSWINWLHQSALRAVGDSDVDSPANLAVTMGRGPKARAVSLVDLSEHPLVRGGRLVSPAFKALVEAMRRSKDQPKGSLILQDHQFWGHFKLGAHSAEVYANFLPPDEGGMIRVRYQEWGTGYDNQTRLYYVARLLQKTGFHVEQDNGHLTAVVDKDHASQTVDQMTDTFALVVQALHATVGVDFALPLLVQGAKTSDEVGRRIDEWVDVVLGEGTLPFYAHDDHNEMVAGWSRYQAETGSRAALRQALDRTLARYGLPAIPRQEVLGQRTIDRFYNGPLEAAIARGQLRLTAGGKLIKMPGYDPLAGVASGLSRDPARAARMAEAVSSLDPGLFRFEPVGAIGALTVERAERALAPDSWVTVYALRDPKSGQIAFSEAGISSLQPGVSPRRLDPAALFSRLAEQGHPIAAFTPAEKPPGLEHFVRLLKSEPAPDRAIGRTAQGLAASPGRGQPVLATVTYDKAKAAQGGYVFVAPYTTPDDLDAIRASKAVLTTSGGLLSHAAITTREMGIAAAILPRAEWREGGVFLESPQFGDAREAYGLRVRDARPSPGVKLEEGVLVRLDPARGAVEVFPPNAGAALRDAAAALERYDKDGDGARLAAWAVHRLGLAALTNLQKGALIHEALDGMAARALARPGAAADLARLWAVLPKTDRDPLTLWTARAADELFAAARRDALELIQDRRDAAAAAISVEAVERALRQAEARAARLADAASALDRPKSAALEAELAVASLREEAKRRSARLLGEDVADLQEHARLFPNATVEILPRLKAAIAKGKRRGVRPEIIAGWEARTAELERLRELKMRAAAPAVLPLSKILDMDVVRVGGKAAKLGEITEVVARAGGEVPPGVALTVDAYRSFLRESGIADKLERIAADGDLSPEEKSSRARKLILEAPLSAESGVGRAIMLAVGREGLGGTMLAVRSSAVDEDGAEAAFAGAGDTHLYVKPEELLSHVKDVWASLWNPRALLYRQTKGLATTNLAQAVVVQAMADSEVSGVAFTQDPVSGDSSRLIVNAAFGLGEGVVSGRVAPDQYVVGKALGREVLPPMVSDKKLAVVRGKDGVGTEERKMPPEWRRRRAMTPAKLEKLNAVALALERHFGYPLDIEFGFVGDKLYILQARPVTNAVSEEPAPPSTPAKFTGAAPAAPAKTVEMTAEPETKRVMFVCTGNTCRSPMAERLAKQKLKDEGRSDFEVLSRGLSAQDGASISDGAERVLREHGADPEGHAALSFSPSDAVWADVILTMTKGQAQALLSRYPQARGKVFTLGEYAGTGGDIADPYGGDVAAYRAAASQIAAGVDAALDRAEHPAPSPVPAQK